MLKKRYLKPERKRRYRYVVELKMSCEEHQRAELQSPEEKQLNEQWYICIPPLHTTLHFVKHWTYAPRHAHCHGNAARPHRYYTAPGNPNVRRARVTKAELIRGYIVFLFVAVRDIRLHRWASNFLRDSRSCDLTLIIWISVKVNWRYGLYQPTQRIVRFK